MTPREFIDDVRAGGDVARHASLYADSDESCDAFREEVAALLWREHDARDLPLVRALVAVETAQALEYDGCTGTLQALAYLLYRLGAEYDVVAIWAAKTANFDAGCMLDARLLTMGRDRATMLAFVDADPGLALRHPGLREALVAAYADATYDSDDDFRASVTGYFDQYFGY
jgi:hypothetical protein